MYTDESTIIEALRNGRLSETACKSHIRNPRLTDERRKMFKIALMKWKLEQLQNDINKAEGS